MITHHYWYAIGVKNKEKFRSFFATIEPSMYGGSILLWFKKKKNRHLCTSAGASHCGHVRDHNEDAYLIQDDVGVFVVADGMGGGAFGERASAVLASPFTHLDAAMSLADKVAEVSKQLHQRHREIYLFSQEINKSVGSTVVVCITAAHENKVAFLWTGDSRAYVLDHKDFKQVTQDHRYVLQLLEAGVISAKEVDNHPYANRLTHAVGVSAHLQLDQCEFSVTGPLRILLCTDGLSGELSITDLKQIIAVHKATAEQCCQRLVEQTLKTRARDNLTAVIVDLNLHN
ncbi:Serine/threonine phosphatase stp [Piscirickettsia salmonis]|uniref:PP2C family protein-serine/threonine phosphatase n=1 Tax=Piscirickettsia salmonis TaxID=1238 RepID=UPI001E2E26AE|nr:protein phosphatase 2C domain-containing protein [Piscirickettsia salmonis]QGP56334.1 Serine/threonine phosphatase stp [Piscirickettsia salmonis]QGP57802.1 Serine/threonine phosphatase stp [Piscirickettsia salmonis]QGP65899.1 Serine/threonine phosphatase stp [Piscirickettsia salmonis]